VRGWRSILGSSLRFGVSSVGDSLMCLADHPLVEPISWVGWKTVLDWVGTVLSNNDVGWVGEGSVMILF
jgi:hypothetical protein